MRFSAVISNAMLLRKFVQILGKMHPKSIFIKIENSNMKMIYPTIDQPDEDVAFSFTYVYGYSIPHHLIAYQT